MPSTREKMAYDSDDSTLYSRGSRRHSRRHSTDEPYARRPRQSRRYSSPPREKSSSSKAGTFVKIGLGVALVQVVATCVSEWMKKREAETERAERRYQREKRHAFEKAKAKRRREEEELERRRDREDDSDDDIEREIIIREGMRITHVPIDADPARDMSEEQDVRRLEAPPEDYHDFSDDSDGDIRRPPSVAARSRSRYGRTGSVPNRDGRSRSRPAERVT